MNTGIESWDGTILDIGPIYPFVGWEGLMVLLAVIFWIGWHILQIRMETRQYNSTAQQLRQGDNLQKAIAAEHEPERM